MIKNSLKITALAVALGFTMYSCNEDSDTTVSDPTNITPTIDTDLVTDDLLIEALFESSQAISNEGSETSTSSFKLPKTYGCATRAISIDTLAKTMTFTYTFDGTSTCVDGQVRDGSFSVSINSLKLKAKGTKFVFTYNNYKVKTSIGETLEASGVRTVENLADIDTINGIHQSVIVHGLGGATTRAIIKKKDSTTVEWFSNRVRKQTAGANTPGDLSDDSAELTGNHGGISAKGTHYSADIKPAIVGKTCSDKPELVSGQLDVTTNATTYSINFGDGGCDGKMTLSGTTTVTVGGVSKQVAIPEQEITIP